MKLTLSEYRAIVESSPNMIWRAGTDAKCDYFNETWLRFTGRRLEEEIGDGWTQGVHPDDFVRCLETYIKAFDKRERFEMEYRLMRHDGKWRWINDRGVPAYSQSGEFAGYIGSCMDVTEKIEGKKLAELACIDKLTGLYSRNHMEYLLDSEFHKARQQQTELTILMMDVDRFKSFNDGFGHAFGDKVLRQVAEKIAENMRKTDIAGRYGGDEFLAILPETSLADAEKTAERVLDSVGSIRIDGLETVIGLSIGIVRKTDEKGINEVIEKADRAMYRAKQAGGGRISAGDGAQG